jgi:hypothetical protein
LSGVEFFALLWAVILWLAEFLGFEAHGACVVRGYEEDRFGVDFPKTIF